jgi:hypothetical protein
MSVPSTSVMSASAAAAETTPAPPGALMPAVAGRHHNSRFATHQQLCMVAAA